MSSSWFDLFRRETFEFDIEQKSSRLTSIRIRTIPKSIFSEIINSTRVYTFLSSTVAQVRQEVHFNSELLKREVILQAQ